MLDKFIDMAKSPEEIKEESLPCAYDQSVYPWGLCMSLDNDSLEKIPLSSVDAGDMIHFEAIGKVTSVSKREVVDKDGNKKPDSRIEIQIMYLALGDSHQEEAPEVAPRVDFRKLYNEA